MYPYFDHIYINVDVSYFDRRRAWRNFELVKNVLDHAHGKIFYGEKENGFIYERV